MTEAMQEKIFETFSALWRRIDDQEKRLKILEMIKDGNEKLSELESVKNAAEYETLESIVKLLQSHETRMIEHASRIRLLEQGGKKEKQDPVKCDWCAGYGFLIGPKSENSECPACHGRGVKE